MSTSQATTCSIEGCDRPHHARGWCSTHWQRWRKRGDPGPAEPLRIVGDDEARFWAKVDKGGSDECWTWTGGRNTNGYGSFAFGGRAALAHRFAYELLVGPIPEGLVLHHVCENPRCVSPAHLEAITQGEHLRLHGAAASGSAAYAVAMAARTTCRRGHPKDIYGYRDARARWRCRECKRLNRQRLRAAGQHLKKPSELLATDKST